MNHFAELRLACTFTENLLRDDLVSAFESQGVQVEIQSAPYGQVAESMLGPLSASYTLDHDRGAHLVVIRPEDGLRSIDSKGRARYGSVSTADPWIEAISLGLERVAAHSRSAVVVCVTPPQPAILLDTELARWAQRAADNLSCRAEAAGCIVIEPPGGAIADRRLDAMVHIPFVRDWIRQLADSLARSALRTLFTPPKVLAFDCDDTLWGGACAELGLDVACDGDWDRLQQFAVNQVSAGRLICLASHNIEADVMRVLDSDRTRLRRRHIAAHRIGWSPKGQMLVDLSRELMLGLDTFVFIDDNAVQRSQVRTILPEVIVPEFHTPSEALEILQQLWGLDPAARTREDSERTHRYHQERSRTALREAANSHEDFVRDLQVETEIRPYHADDNTRVEQLLQRVTQFSARSPSFEGLCLTSNGQAIRAWTVDVVDRLGDYGRVGVLVDRAVNGVLVVECLVLSCRVLGRGVETAILNRIREDAEEQHCHSVRLEAIRTERNEPVQAFVRWAARGRVRCTSATIGSTVPLAFLNSSANPTSLHCFIPAVEQS